MSYNTYNSPIFVLVTTFNRNELLKSRSLVSISNQTIDFEGIIMVEDKATAAKQISCSTQGASDVITLLTTEANSPLQDKDPYDNGYAIVSTAPAGKAIAGNVVLTSSGKVITLTTCYAINDADTGCSTAADEHKAATLTNTVTLD